LSVVKPQLPVTDAHVMEAWNQLYAREAPDDRPIIQPDRGHWLDQQFLARLRLALENDRRIVAESEE
jgi:hypothetical protein